MFIVFADKFLNVLPWNKLWEFITWNLAYLSSTADSVDTATLFDREVSTAACFQDDGDNYQ